jgi:hypothetical protein
MSATASAPKARVGQQTPWGVATRFCRRGLDGRWACTLHRVASFVDRAELARHLDDESDGPHRVAFRCLLDGETHGWTS